MPTFIQTCFTDVFRLFYPDVCLSCGKALLRHETVLCFHCDRQLPQTDYWKQPENALMKRFWGRVPLQGAAALYYFQKKGGVQYLLHHLKYKGRKDVGTYCGAILGGKLRSADSIIRQVELVVPVPLHWKKQRLRGYNQCEPFAQKLAEALRVPYSADALERKQENVSQTTKTRFDRWDNVAEIFAVKKEQQLRGKHVLLVDDVVTTGATAEACLQTILSVPDTQVSFAAIAVARHR